jgi:hypothetical protein
MGGCAGITITLLPYPNTKLPYFIHTLLIASALFSVVLWQFSLHNKLPIVLGLIGLIAIGSYITTVLYNSKRFTNLFNHLKTTV